MKKSQKFFILLALSSFMLTKTSKAMDKVQEIWNDIPSLSGNYQISNQGRVRCTKRAVTYKDGRIGNFPGRILKTGLNRDGYVLVYPTVQCVKFSFTVHRLVAIQYVENPDNLPEVNHEDGNKENNAWWNLKWCTRGANMQHAHDTGLVKIPSRSDSNCAKSVFQLSLSGDFIAAYGCLKDCEDATGIGFRQISRVATGDRKTTGGFKFTYTDPRL